MGSEFHWIQRRGTNEWTVTERQEDGWYVVLGDEREYKIEDIAELFKLGPQIKPPQ